MFYLSRKVTISKNTTRYVYVPFHLRLSFRHNHFVFRTSERGLYVKKFGMLVGYIHMKRTMSQRFHLGPSFHFLKSRQKASRFFNIKINENWDLNNISEKL